MPGWYLGASFICCAETFFTRPEFPCQANFSRLSRPLVEQEKMPLFRFPFDNSQPELSDNQSILLPKNGIDKKRPREKVVTHAGFSNIHHISKPSGIFLEVFCVNSVLKPAQGWDRFSAS
jgi:hypothetical protein